MVGTLAGTIQGESDGTPASMFAVASVIYNRSQNPAFGSSNPDVLVNAPSQFTGQSNNPSATAQALASAVQNGTLSQYGNPGNALYFQQAGSSGTVAQASNVNVGGNVYSDTYGAPSSAFQAPQYGMSNGPALASDASTTYYTQPPGYGTNFNTPASTPDTFGQSVTPGSREQTTIPPGSYMSGGDGSEPGATPSGIDPVTGEPDIVLPDVNAGAPVTYGGAGSGGTTSAAGFGGAGDFTGAGAITTNPQGVAAQSGQGTPIQVNLSPQTAADAQSWVTAPITAAEKAASAWFASASNWFTRGFLLVLAAVILLVALWHVSGQPSPSQIIEAAAK